MVLFQGENGEEVLQMKIDSAILGMDSARSYKAASYSYRRFELKDYSDVYSGLGRGQEDSASGGDSLSNKAQSNKENEGGAERITSGTAIMSLQEKMSAVKRSYRVRNDSASSLDTIRQESIKYIFELLFGHKKERLKKWLDEHYGTNNGYDVSNNVASNSNGIGGGNNTSIRATSMSTTSVRTFDYYSENYNYESEETSFAANGVVKTADGREIQFKIDVSMSREFASYYEESTHINIKDKGVSKYAALCDPLVINLNGNVASVSDQKIRFDIDGDGELDNIGRLAQGSGYLALDKNNDGKINDGNELFGTKSGDGFADLAKYDSDGNGWIDENDPI